MTLTHLPVDAPSVDAPSVDEGPLTAADPRRRVAAICLASVSVLALSFVVFVGAMSPIEEHRAQVVDYVALRNALALQTQPVSEPLPVRRPVALIEIPSLRLSEVVLEGTDSGTLMDGPGHLRSSVLPGQSGLSVLLGRHSAFGGPFRDIGLLRRGAEIVTTTGQGVARYTVVGTGRSGGSAAGRPTPPVASAGLLELVTAGGRSYRPSGVVWVDAVLVRATAGTGGSTASSPFPADAPLPAVGPAEAALGGDPAATVPLELWSQLLLVVTAALAVAWTRFGRPETWLVGAPVVLAVGWQVAEAATRLLPNLL